MDIDEVCSHLSGKIYEFSDERLEKLEQEHAREKKEIDSLKTVKTSN